MRIELTPEQAAEFDNPFWDIPYKVTIDGTEYTGNVNDDDFREIPEIPLVGDLAPMFTVPDDDTTPIVGYAMNHPGLTWEDEVILKFVLDERAAKMQTIRDLPAPQRPDARQALRTAERQAARSNTRKEARIVQRIEDRQAARRDFRQELRTDARIAARIEARRLEREAAGGGV